MGLFRFNMKNKREKAGISKHSASVFIILGILILIAIGVYGLAPGVVPNPGHNINEISIPSGCQSGQFLQWDGNKWICADICPAGTHNVTSSYTNVLEDVYGSGTSISCSGLPTDTCNGSTSAYTCLAGESRTCTDIAVYNCPPMSQCLAPNCISRTVTCKKAAMICGE
jgi:hypothetical protein